VALRTLANFIDGLPDDDRDLSLEALSRTQEIDGRLELAEDASVLLSRFGLDYGAWQSESPSEKQGPRLGSSLNEVSGERGSKPVPRDDPRPRVHAGLSTPHETGARTVRPE
jgi:hypothetical protein